MHLASLVISYSPLINQINDQTVMLFNLIQKIRFKGSNPDSDAMLHGKRAFFPKCSVSYSKLRCRDNSRSPLPLHLLRLCNTQKHISKIFHTPHPSSLKIITKHNGRTKHTFCTLLLLRSPLSPLFGKHYVLQSILLVIIPRLGLLIKMSVCFLQIFDCGNATRIVSGDRRTAQTLTEDAVASAETEGIVSLGENAALDLENSE